MALTGGLLFLETWDHYTNSLTTASEKWTDGQNVLGFVTGEFASTNAASAPQVLSKTLTADKETILAGGRFRHSGFIGSSTTKLFNVRTSGGTEFFAVYVRHPSNELEIVTSAGTTTSNLAAGVLAADTWYTVEAAIRAVGASSNWEVKVNQGQISDLTGTATLTLQNGRLVALGALTQASTLDVDWFWIKGGTALWASSDFIGNARKGVSKPNAADGTYGAVNWTHGGSGAGSLYTSLDEAAFNSDTDFLKDSTDAGGAPGTNDRVGWGYEDAPSAATSILAVQRTIGVKQSVGSGGTLKPFLTNLASANPPAFYGTSLTGLSPNWVFRTQAYDAAPDGTAWTVAKFNALLGGVECNDL